MTADLRRLVRKVCMHGKEITKETLKISPVRD